MDPLTLSTIICITIVALSPNTLCDGSITDKVLRRTENITKSPGDKRQYRGLELLNHMKILLISDPSTDKAAAALEVNVGYMSDPKEVQGLAHFCEHMLFMGTEKYPDENDYLKFLNEHGGDANAYTFNDYTIYHFNVLPHKLLDVLDRFSQFFVAPLFTASAIGREIDSVNSEHETDIPNDQRRLSQLNQHLADPDHPFHCFGTGNKYTLDTLPKEKNINIRERLLQFYDQWYSSNIMSLVVLGKESLDELEEAAVKLFSVVKNKFVQAPKWDEYPFKEKDLGTYVYVEPVNEVNKLLIIFPSPDVERYYKSAPFNYIGKTIGDEGPGSILSKLKSKGWSNGLITESVNEARGISCFKIHIDLTEDGVNHVDDIVRVIFEYLNMLKSQRPQKWIYDEDKDLHNIMFRFQEAGKPEEYVQGLVYALQEYPMEDVLSYNYLLSEWKPHVIESIWSNFVPEKIRLIVVGKKFQNIVDQTEPWFGTKYKISKIPEETLETWRNAEFSDSFRLPKKNDFIPKYFNLYPKDKYAPQHPRIIKNNALVRVWFKQDDTFLVPKTKMIFYFVSPLASSDTLSRNLIRMLVDLVKDSLTEYTYSALVAGLTWDLSVTGYSFKLSIGGYSNKQDSFLCKVMEKLTNFKIDPERFEISKENYIKELRQMDSKPPYEQVLLYSLFLLSEHSYSHRDLLATAEQLTVDKLKIFIPQVLSRLHVECLIHGNANKKSALQLVQIVENHLSIKSSLSPLVSQELLLKRVVKLEEPSSYVYKVTNDVYKESGIEVYYQCGLTSTENNVKLQLLSSIIQDQCFDILRNKEQLGYVVYCDKKDLRSVQGLTFIIQSLKHPVYLENRIMKFLKNMLIHITDMSNEQFLNHREAVAAKMLEKPQQLFAQTEIYWDEIEDQEYNFERGQVEADYLSTLTKNDIIGFYKNLIGENSQRKISVHIVSMADGGAGKQHNDMSKEEVSKLIYDITTFKASHEMFPLVQPYINISRKGYY